MWVRQVIEALLRAWVKHFGLARKKPASPGIPVEPLPNSVHPEPDKPYPGKVEADEAPPIASPGIPAEPPPKPAHPQPDKPYPGKIEADEAPPIASPGIPAEPPPKPAHPQPDKPYPGKVEADEAPPIALPGIPAEPPPNPAHPQPDKPYPGKVEADEAPPIALPAGDDKQHLPPKAGEHSESGKPDSIAGGDNSARRPQKSKGEPHQIPGRRGPQPVNSERRQSPSSHPELVCHKAGASTTWEIILSADEECRLVAVHHEGKPLEDAAPGQYHLPSLEGRLTVSYQDGQKRDVPLFENNTHLIFKLRKNWSGEGRRVARITSGHFIVVAPKSWQRTGKAPVEPDDCADPAFRAHYFYQPDAIAPGEGGGGFREWDASVASGLELTGQRIYDDSDDGTLFVGEPPGLKPLPNIEWARVGEETKNGWGQNFQPDRQSLRDVLAGREGRFFLRVYDSEVSMIDSVTFRYLRNLRRIDVNGTEYAQQTVFVPTTTGYPPTEVRFVGAKGSTLPPVLPLQAPQIKAPSDEIEVPPRPEADYISCSLGTDASSVNIVLDLPRIWWRLEDGQGGPGDWSDRPLEKMTRPKFQKLAHSNASLSLLSKRFDSVRAGFDHERGQPYRVKDKCIAIPLDHFVDCAQIDQRLNDDTHFNVEWGGKIVSPIVIRADPEPEIVSFTAKPATISAGQQASLEWMTRNASDALVVIEPEPHTGLVESDGTCTVCPTETTPYTLTLFVPGVNDISKTVTVTVESSPGPRGSRAARVKSRGGVWRKRPGKGFSPGELQDAGLTVTEAKERSIPFDKRRQTSHPANVETLRSIFDD